MEAIISYLIYINHLFLVNITETDIKVFELIGFIKRIITRLPFNIGGKILLVRYRLTIKYKFKALYGYDLNIDKPKTFSEKIFYRKYHGNAQTMSFFADKYRVRRYVEQKVGEEFLIPLLGVYDEITLFDLEKLPNKFVLKTNHGSGKDHIEIVQDKRKINLEHIVKKMNAAVRQNFGISGDEKYYSLIKRKIIAEKYMDSFDNDLPDYKFHCFKGHDPYIAVDVDRFVEHKRAVFDHNWKLTNIKLNTFKDLNEYPEPINFNLMKKVAAVLSEKFDYVRIDLYNINGEIYFGEITQTPANGMELLEPLQYSFDWGNKWVIEPNNKFLYSSRECK